MTRFSKGVSKAALERAGIEPQPGDFGSDLEGALAAVIAQASLPAPSREVRLVEGRDWRCDFVWRGQWLVVECEGGTYAGGRHTRGRGFEDDCRKYAELTLRGWIVLRVTSAHIASGEALGWIERALALKAQP